MNEVKTQTKRSSIKKIIKDFSLSLWTSLCSLFIFGVPAFAASNTLTPPTVTTTTGGAGISTGVSSKDPGSLINKFGVSIFGWLAALTLLTAICLIVFTTLKGMSKTHSGASQALKDSMSQIGVYIILLVIAFGVSLVFAIVLAIKSGLLS